MTVSFHFSDMPTGFVGSLRNLDTNLRNLDTSFRSFVSMLRSLVMKLRCFIRAAEDLTETNAGHGQRSIVRLLPPQILDHILQPQLK